MSVWIEIAKHIGESTGEPFRLDRTHSVGGGCINATEVLEGDGRKYFVKLNDAAQLDMFEAEAAGLSEIVDSRTIRTPKPVVTGTAGGQAYLILEYLELGGRGGSKSDAALGHNLAAMHRTTRPQFGWWRDNTIGSTPQINTLEDDWITFWREHRLRYQLELAADHGAGRLLRAGEKLLDVLPAFFRDYRPSASLLHGDLWGGNHGTLRDGTPVIFDPAVYYGDRETDLAMTELFGGFSPAFYAAYNEAWPLDAGYRVRRELYNLYHVLNHYNLFGGGYGSQAEGMIGQLMSAVQ
jgi:protein-ribulosamine 3-kinase